MNPFDVFLYELCAEMTALDQEDDSMRREFDSQPSFMRPALISAFASTVKAGVPDEIFAQVEAAYNAKIEPRKAAKFFYELGIIFENLRKPS